MQTRSQSRKLLLLAQENDTFEIPVSTVNSSKNRKKKTEENDNDEYISIVIEEVKNQVIDLTKVTSASKRVLPDSIKNCIHNPINCALYMPKYIQKPVYEVDIDFDEASEAWRANKTSIGNGEYKYKKKVKF